MFYLFCIFFFILWFVSIYLFILLLFLLVPIILFIIIFICIILLFNFKHSKSFSTHSLCNFLLKITCYLTLDRVSKLFFLNFLFCLFFLAFFFSFTFGSWSFRRMGWSGGGFWIFFVIIFIRISIILICCFCDVLVQFLLWLAWNCLYRAWTRFWLIYILYILISYFCILFRLIVYLLVQNYFFGGCFYPFDRV